MNLKHAKAETLEPVMDRPDTLTLERDRFTTLRGASQIRVTHGSLWLTVDGEPDDVFLEPGQGVALPAGARVLVQAVHAPARAVVLRPAGWHERLRVAWQTRLHAAVGAHP
jgi:Protein of unknown function (DUF2917)